MARNRSTTRRMGCCSSKRRRNKFTLLGRVELRNLNNSSSDSNNSSDPEDELIDDRNPPEHNNSAMENENHPPENVIEVQVEVHNPVAAENNIQIHEGNLAQDNIQILNENWAENNVQIIHENLALNNIPVDEYPEAGVVDAVDEEELFIIQEEANSHDDTMPLVALEEHSPDLHGSPRPRVQRYVRAPEPSNQRLAIPRASFDRLCRAIFQQYRPGCRVGKQALEALQEAAEDYLVGLLADAYKITGVRKKVTLQPQDLKVALEIRGNPSLIPGSNTRGNNGITRRRYNRRYSLRSQAC